ncbi:MAG: hypothetical protein EOP83_21325 [Verrucomicrobiaceae bacterium]|nr:MAG: hypothetical protein EOP83_21325 [Verrucomicrobiaceae bacterium]
MKKLLLRAFALIAAVLPLSVAQAAPKPPAVFGEFAVGKTFTFTVVAKTVSATQGTNVVPNAVVPKGVPNLAVGQQVTFVIGKKGELIGPGFKADLLPAGSSVTANIYAPKKSPMSVFTVNKNTTTHEPINVSVYIIHAKYAKRVMTTTQISYTIQ